MQAVADRKLLRKIILLHITPPISASEGPQFGQARSLKFDSMPQFYRVRSGGKMPAATSVPMDPVNVGEITQFASVFLAQ
jgi:hypothetical protein